MDIPQPIIKNSSSVQLLVSTQYSSWGEPIKHTNWKDYNPLDHDYLGTKPSHVSSTRFLGHNQLDVFLVGRTHTY